MLRPWNFGIVIRRNVKAAVFLQIAHAIVDDIKRGRLAPGAALPGTRELAASLNINRKTVIQTYAELEAQGWVTSEKARGTFISARLPEIEVNAKGAPRAGRIPERPDFRLVGTAPNIPLIQTAKDMLVFDDGAPDTRQIPVDALARAYRNALGRRIGHDRLGYGDPRGIEELRAAISNMLNMDRGLVTTLDNVCLTRGSQMAIYLAARILVGPGDAVVMEELSYPPAREAFRYAGAEVLPVPLDGHGIRVDELEKICRKKRVRAVYVTPHHQFPTTVLMKPDRRLRLLTLAAQFGFAVVEDDYDHEFHFAHRPMLPLASVDMSGKVVYIGSLSKILSPSLRLGYLVGPKAFVDRAASEIMMIDRQGDPATEAAVSELIESGELHRHTRKMKKLYGERREFFAGLLKSLHGSDIEFTIPDGGLAFWVQFKNIDLDSLVAMARRRGVIILPARAFFTTPRSINAARLGFASMDLIELRDAVQGLTIALRRVNRSTANAK
jgi:GntR family transcriptional regulator / MocR family aminotransferase